MFDIERRKFVYFSGGPEGADISSESVKGLKDKKEAGEQKELDVDSLVADSNKILEKHEEEIHKLPKDFQNALHDNVVQYFLASADRYDANAEKGLNKAEFGKYKADMLQKLQEIVKKYAPTEEDEKENKEKEMAARKALKYAEKGMEAQDTKIEDVNFDEANLSSPEGIQGEFTKFNAQSGDMRKESAEVSQSFAAFQKTLKIFNENKTYIDLFSDSPELKILQDRLEGLKQKFDQKIQEVRSKKDKITAYGRKIEDATAALRGEKIKERDQKLKNIDENSTEADKQKMKDEVRYGQLQQQQTKLGAQRINLEKYRDNLTHQTEAVDEKEKKTQVEAESLKTFNEHLEDAVAQIDQALSGDLPEEQKKQLEEKKKSILDRKGGIDDALKGSISQADAALDAKKALEAKKIEAKMGLDNVNMYLEKTVNPSMEDVSSSIKEIEIAKLKNGTEKEQVQAEYMDTMKTIDDMDRAVADNVLENNLANTQILNGLEQQRKALDSVEVEKAGAWEVTGGKVFSTIGEGITLFTKDLLCETLLDPFSKMVKRATKDIPGVNFLVAAGCAVTVDLVSGVVEGTGELINGVSQMLADPVNTGKGLGALIGRNPATGEWSFSNAGNALKEMGKAMIALEDFEKGHVGKGIGKVALNVLLTATGIGAATKGAEAASVVLRIAAKEAAKTGVKVGVMTTLKAGAIGGGVFVKEFAVGLCKIPKGALIGVGKALKSIPQIGKGAGAAAKLYAELIGEGAGKLEAGLKAGYKGAGETAKAVVEDVKAIREAGLKGAAEGAKDAVKGAYSGALEKGSKAVKDIKAMKHEGGWAKTIKEGIANKFKEARRDFNDRKFNGLVKDETGAKIDMVKYEKDFAEYEQSLSEMVKSGIKEGDAVKALFKENPDLVMKAFRYEKAEAKLAKAREAIEARIYTKDVRDYTNLESSVSKYGDDCSDMRRKYKIDPVKNDGTTMRMKTTGEALEEARGKAVAAGTTKDIEAIDGLLAMEEKLGRKLDAFNDLHLRIKNRRSESHSWADDADFKAHAKEKGIDDILRLEPEQLKALKEEFLQKNMKEFIERSGLDINMELKRMDQSLYRPESGIKRWDIDGLKAMPPGEIQSAMHSHLEQFTKGKNAPLSKDAARLMEGRLNDVMEAASKAGVSSEDILVILNDSADKMIYQTMESFKRQMPDHGIRHISGNIRVSEKIMDAYEKASEGRIVFTAEDRLQMMLTQINHDIGYTSAIDLKGFTGTNAHPIISTQFLERSLGEGVEAMNNVYGGLFGPEGYGRMKSAILNHDGLEVLRVAGAAEKEAAFLNVIKLSDNLALFSFDKLPEVFMRNPDCAKLLGQIEQAVKNGRPELLGPLKNQMRTQILDMQVKGLVSSSESRGLMQAVDEVNSGMTAKKSLGTLAGEHGDEVVAFTIGKDGELVPTLQLKSSPAFEKIEEALKTGDRATLDAGTQQFMAIMKDYAENNNCIVQIVNKDGSIHAIKLYGKMDDATKADALARVKEAIKSGETVELVKDGKALMNVDFGSTVERGVAGTKAGLTKEISGIDAKLGRGITVKERAALLRQRESLSMQLHQAETLDVAEAILKNTEEIKQLKTVGEIEEAQKNVVKAKKAYAENPTEAAKEALEGARAEMLETTNRLVESLPEDLSTRVSRIINEAGAEDAKLQAISEVIQKGYDTVFNKYNIANQLERDSVLHQIHRVGEADDAQRATGAGFKI
ncbi:MAG: hypothetical protein UT33_C0012G0069 [Candidatus Peregrinibacteria bacterium GW2011_GWC2_39_14]|nr:MAG: hypothetical protein US92_C0003G0096 [Candidatus Peregrinibacteria bacterium GW2011_GWA2_38_36]KKR05264.1 MAG: hypothetical protein UT33_C0012G0069 [Candidatus Peregrinibacteria bacterium GW2011_GWC2_39_14]